jgi:hypothetical protein
MFVLSSHEDKAHPHVLCKLKTSEYFLTALIATSRLKLGVLNEE